MFLLSTLLISTNLIACCCPQSCDVADPNDRRRQSLDSRRGVYDGDYGERREFSDEVDVFTSTQVKQTEIPGTVQDDEQYTQQDSPEIVVTAPDGNTIPIFPTQSGKTTGSEKFATKNVFLSQQPNNAFLIVRSK